MFEVGLSAQMTAAGSTAQMLRDLKTLTKAEIKVTKETVGPVLFNPAGFEAFSPLTFINVN